MICSGFIAGTPVHTDKGLVPIEQLKVGDLVLSQPEEQGERAYRRITQTFVHDDAPIWVVKYMLIDGDVPWGHPEYMPKNETLHHCYVTSNHPFWVEGKGWTAAEELKQYQVLELANGQRSHVHLNSPVVRSTQPGFVASARTCTPRARKCISLISGTAATCGNTVGFEKARRRCHTKLVIQSMR